MEGIGGICVDSILCYGNWLEGGNGRECGIVC